MALDDMPAEPVARLERALEIEARPLGPVADSSALEGGRDGRCLEPARSEITDGQTGPVDGDALAAGEVIERCGDAQLASGIGLPHAFHLAHLLDQPREHSDLTQRVNRHHVFAKFRASDDPGIGELAAEIVESIEWTERRVIERDR